jgi:hypothetical protein
MAQRRSKEKKKDASLDASFSYFNCVKRLQLETWTADFQQFRSSNWCCNWCWCNRCRRDWQSHWRCSLRGNWAQNWLHRIVCLFWIGRFRKILWHILRRRRWSWRCHWCRSRHWNCDWWGDSLDCWRNHGATATRTGSGRTATTFACGCHIGLTAWIAKLRFQSMNQHTRLPATSVAAGVAIVMTNRSRPLFTFWQFDLDRLALFHFRRFTRRLSSTDCRVFLSTSSTDRPFGRTDRTCRNRQPSRSHG